MPGFELSDLLPDPKAPRPQPVQPGPTAEYGEYIASILCAECHGENCRGGEHPDPAAPKPPPDLAAVAAWSLDGFKETLQTGVTPAGVELDPKYMPWEVTQHMTDEGLEALWCAAQTTAHRRGGASRGAGMSEAHRAA